MQRQLIHAIESSVAQATGRSYLIDWSKLDVRELRELQRFMPIRFIPGNPARLLWRVK